ncbi:VOC family protein [Candidatus Bathyarchaeota archaeon]|nr:VOC family protein [Candidatus Bathyarchaeota archaeon]MBL7168294.1 VOC family protein [Candidatus Bathyarchaeota archaeon]
MSRVTPPLFKRIDCVRLPVSDLESGLSFYRDNLGLELIWRTEDSAGLRLPNDESEIVLYTEDRGEEIDITVESADEAARSFESARGEVVVQPFDIGIGRCVVVKDPWGNELVLLDNSKGRLVTDAGLNVVGVDKL